MSSRCSRRKCQPSGPKWGEVLPLQPDNKDLIQLALLHQRAAAAACRQAGRQAVCLSVVEQGRRHTDQPASSLHALT